MKFICLNYVVDVMSKGKESSLVYGLPHCGIFLLYRGSHTTRKKKKKGFIYYSYTSLTLTSLSLTLESYCLTLVLVLLFRGFGIAYNYISYNTFNFKTSWHNS